MAKTNEKKILLDRPLGPTFSLGAAADWLLPSMSLLVASRHLSAVWLIWISCGDRHFQ